MISIFVYYLFQFIFLIIIIECILSWIPNIDNNKQPYLFIHGFSNLFLAPVRMILPSVGGLDLSPILALIIIQICGNAICKMLVQFGL